MYLEFIIVYTLITEITIQNEFDHLGLQIY